MTSSSDPAAASATERGYPGPIAAARTVQAGQVIAERYRIECEVGRGGMGVVYRAQHVLTARRVALKLLGQHAGIADERALNEARSAASLRHPNVVEVLDVEQHDGAPFLVMELLTGEVLSARTPGAQDVSQLLCWLLPILGAVAALHERGFVHGDLKPANVLLNNEGARSVPKLIDFGLASALFDRSLLAAPLYGTPRYMAPERAAGADLTVQADVWSMGMTLLECLAGEAAMPGTLAAHRPDLPGPLVRAIERALQPDLHLRHATLRALVRNLVEACWLAGIVLPDDPDPIGLPELRSWRHEAHQRLLSETHSVESEQPSNQRRRRTTLLVWAVPSVLAVGAMAGWAYWTRMASVAATPRAPVISSRAQTRAPVISSRAQTRASTPPVPPSAPAPDERAAQRPEAATTADAPRTTPEARRTRAAKPEPEPERENDDITGDWR